jgi:hypothetical protein
MGAPTLYRDPKSATGGNADTSAGPSSARSVKDLRIQEHTPELPDNDGAEDVVHPSVKFTRTKGLIFAAVRLWELKRGIRW